MTAREHNGDVGMQQDVGIGVGQVNAFPAARRSRYRPPRLRDLGCAADLLEVLGPAQANYGGPNVL